jgi:hypothetical protein
VPRILLPAEYRKQIPVVVSTDVIRRLHSKLETTIDYLLSKLDFSLLVLVTHVDVVSDPLEGRGNGVRISFHIHGQIPFTRHCLIEGSGHEMELTYLEEFDDR